MGASDLDNAVPGGKNIYRAERRRLDPCGLKQFGPEHPDSRAAGDEWRAWRKDAGIFRVDRIEGIEVPFPGHLSDEKIVCARHCEPDLVESRLRRSCHGKAT